MSLQAFLVNRVWIVIDNDTKEQVGEPHFSKVEAERFMEEHALAEWREAKPDVAPAISWDSDDPTDTLLSIIDKPEVVAA
jgi:hypothetical protein